jgi:hypothetical protein
MSYLNIKGTNRVRVLGHYGITLWSRSFLFSRPVPNVKPIFPRSSRTFAQFPSRTQHRSFTPPRFLIVTRPRVTLTRFLLRPLRTQTTPF